jgi:hypothetical protein
MFGFGFLASGNGAAAGYGFMDVGVRDRIRAPYGFVPAGIGAAIIACGFAATGSKADFEVLKR